MSIFLSHHTNESKTFEKCPIFVIPVKLVLDLIGERESSLFKWLNIPRFPPEFIPAKAGT
jgi:hypothetical protein